MNMSGIWREARRRERAMGGWGSPVGKILAADNGRIRPRPSLPKLKFLDDDGDEAECDGEQAASQSRG